MLQLRHFEQLISWGIGMKVFFVVIIIVFAILFFFFNHLNLQGKWYSNMSMTIGNYSESGKFTLIIDRIDGNLFQGYFITPSGKEFEVYGGKYTPKSGEIEFYVDMFDSTFKFSGQLSRFYGNMSGNVYSMTILGTWRWIGTWAFDKYGLTDKYRENSNDSGTFEYSLEKMHQF